MAETRYSVRIALINNTVHYAPLINKEELAHMYLV